MSKRLRRILFWLWPPYEAHIAQLAIDSEIASNHQERMNSIRAKIKASLPDDTKLPKEMESFAKLVLESENKRRETLEGKALGFVSGFGIAISIVSALPILIGEKWNLSTPAALILGILYVFGILHLMTAVYWSVEARRVEGLALPDADEYIKAVQDRSWGLSDRVLMYICKVKFNEPVLTKKANSLAVAESMFLRGLFFIALAAIIGGGIMIFGAKAITVASCKVPDVVGLDQVAAEEMLVKLGLQPIRSNQYSANVKVGTVIRQDPIADSLIKPCDAGITIVFSLGPTPTTSLTPISTNTPKPTDLPTPTPPIPTP
jgi:hypothetical protein